MSRKVKEALGRPREFDRDTVLTQAMHVFWNSGFSRTTYASLEQATGLHRQSLVYAFGDKESLFYQALSHYAETQVQSIINQLEAPGSPLKNIRAAFAEWLEDAQRETTSGCLFVNTSAEIGQSDPKVAQIIETATKRLIQAFEQVIEAGQTQGEITVTISAIDLAQQAVAVGDGVLLRRRVSNDPSFAEAVFRAFLASIECRDL
ncbi:MAG: TetR family transcriptional regulator C-terminal domain-containing protein [Stenomitos rutilans HA7619-LM2]|jgi:TetR/AcrR family transcriptional repressor of nem operon|nr:TetR family transcriptional regulator C-terminal domain-containing protein [Stenomitos rutilans HA7619-LM2]